MIFRRTVAQFRFLADDNPVYRTVEFVGFRKAISTCANTGCNVAETVRPSSAYAKRYRATSQSEFVMPSGVNVNPKEIVVAASQAMMVRF